ncbi:hypothetical protein ATK74_0173 [Propionicimonas paludicola]|uniref:O-antigen ligase-like membrane protein n=1 Tax=Propionicimonas paludicola TaxID=185243 RepID=A0A2A9CMM3_9ACTN|nr:hypothetical protein [Propionicimonas paludicola]PFG15653.1 hypothetical protein ATK74_0173 [Propionicimonas paludicola]
MQIVLLVAGLAAAGLGWLLMRRSPSIGFAGMCVVIAFVPVWWAISFGTDWRPPLVFGVVLLASFLGRLPRRYGLADLGVAIFFAAGLLPVLVGGASLSTVFILLTEWVLGFLIGRFVFGIVGPERIYATIVVVFAVAAGFGIFEFVADFHLWKILGPHNRLYNLWAQIQYRAGLPRSEGAFGHSIAFGCAMAMAVPMVYATRFKPWLKVVLTGILGVAVLVSFSRAAMLAAAIGLLVIAIRGAAGVDRASRGAAWLSLGLGGLGLVPIVFQVIEQAGSEASGSATYRGQLYDLVAVMKIVGRTAAAQTSLTGERSVDGFRSIDSQIVLTGLSYGWLMMLIGLVLLGIAVVLVLIGRSSPAMVAVVAQLPALASVALITQYGTLFWIVVGLAVASRVAAPEPEVGPAVDEELSASAATH